MTKPTHIQLRKRVKELEKAPKHSERTPGYSTKGIGKIPTGVISSRENNKSSTEDKHKIKFDLKKLQSILDNVVDGIVSITKDGLIIAFNAAAEKIFQYKAEEVIGQNVMILMPEPYRGAHDQYLKNYLTTNNAKVIGIGREVKGKKKDGTVFPLYLGVSETSVDEAISFTAILRDMTEWKKDQEQLKRFRAALDLSPDQIYLIDPVSMKFLDVNEHTLKVLGFSRKELLKMGPVDIKPYYTKKQLSRKFRDVIEGKSRIGKIETVHRKKDGTDIVVEVFLSKVEIDGKDLIVAVARDYTEQQSNKKALRLSEERYALAQKAAKIGSWDWDIKTGNVAWSDTIEPMFGFEKGEFGGTYDAFIESVHPDDRQHVNNAVERALEGIENYDTEYRVVWQNGSIHWISAAGEVMRDDKGKPYRMLGIVSDVTTKKELEIELAHLRKEYEAFMRHELNNHLAPITNYVQVLLNTPSIKIDQMLDSYLEKIKISVFNAVGLIKNLKKLQDFEQDKHTIETEKFRLHSVLDYVVDSFLILENTLGIKIDYKVESGNYNMNMDVNLLSGVFQNLIKNAIEHVQGLDSKRDKTIKIRLSNDNGKLHVVVNNKGVPVPPARLELFFDKFNTDKSTKREGSGLGTTYAYLVTKAHGGRIWVESNEEDGTTVHTIFDQAE